MKPTSLLLVGLGGAFGAMSRYAVATLVAARTGMAWPYGTFLINISGCFAIGLVLTAVTDRVLGDEAFRELIAIGFIGAYTTFSTYSLETVRLLQAGAFARATSYVVLSTGVGLAAIVLGMALGRRF